MILAAVVRQYSVTEYAGAEAGASTVNLNYYFFFQKTKQAEFDMGNFPPEV